MHNKYAAVTHAV